ncbi:MAG: alpha/beta hydrolase fold domain-containing protein [Halioglobus sp.]
MSFTLRIFNILLKIFSRRGMGDIHLSDNTAQRFVEHATQMDNLAARFIKNNVHPVIATEREHWVWVGDPTKSKRHILYLHGGGFITHMPKTYRYWADRLATMNDASVLLVDYRLAPAHPHPAGLNDCLDAYRWMVQDQKIPAHKIVIGGDSAGANLALTILLRIKEEKLPYPACTFALSPPVDLKHESPSILSNGNKDLFGDHHLVKKIASIYVPSQDYDDCTVSPLFGDFSGVTPILLHAANNELVRDDSVRFYSKFKEVVPLELKLWDHVPHCHQLFGFLPESLIARDNIQAFIAKHCAP